MDEHGMDEHGTDEHGTGDRGRRADDEGAGRSVMNTLPPPTGAPVVTLQVLASSATATMVAQRLGLLTCEEVPPPGAAPVVVVLADAAEVHALAELGDRSWVGCAIAWHLPEEALHRLYDCGVPVFVGLPSIDQVIQTSEYPPADDEIRSARSVASRLATIEALLGAG